MEAMTSSPPWKYPVSVARPERRLEPHAEKVLRRLQAAQRKIQKIEATRDTARAAADKERSDIIEEALKAGYTLRSLGRELGGISPQRVQQMRSTK